MRFRQRWLTATRYRRSRFLGAATASASAATSASWCRPRSLSPRIRLTSSSIGDTLGLSMVTTQDTASLLDQMCSTRQTGLILNSSQRHLLEASVYHASGLIRLAVPGAGLRCSWILRTAQIEEKETS